MNWEKMTEAQRGAFHAFYENADAVGAKVSHLGALIANGANAEAVVEKARQVCQAIKDTRQNWSVMTQGENVGTAAEYPFHAAGLKFNETIGEYTQRLLVHGARNTFRELLAVACRIYGEDNIPMNELEC